MKKLGLILILVILMGVLPVQAQTDNYYTLEQESRLKIFKDATGYDTLIRPDGSTFIQSQRYTIEYQDGPKWKQVTVPYSVTENDGITRHYTDYLGTTAQVIYNQKEEGGVKTDVVINSGQTRNYRIVWTLDGISNTDYTLTENGIVFNSVDDWVKIDWSDAFNQYGDITTYSVTDSAGGKKLQVYFNIGIIETGKTKILDPVLIDSYTSLNTGTFTSLTAVHPSAGNAYSAGSQSFQVSGEYDLAAVSFNLIKIGNPTGTAHAVLYAHSGIFGTSSAPTGAALATSDNFNVSTVGAGYTYMNLTFSGANQYTLQNGVRYCIVLQIDVGGTYDSSNYIRMRVDAAGTYAGNFARYRFSTWNPEAAQDAQFYLYGADILNITQVNATSTFSTGSYGWVNVTVVDSKGVSNLDRVNIFCNTTGGETFNLSWAQATNTFTEVSDPSGICTLFGSNRTIVDPTTARVGFRFRLSGGTTVGVVNVNVSAFNDDGLNDTSYHAALFQFVNYDWNPIGDLIDSAFSIFGINNYMANALATVTALGANFINSLTGFVTMVSLQLQVIWAVFSWVSGWITRIITTALTFGTTLKNILNGIGTGTTNIWTFFNFNAWIDVVPVFLIAYWIDSMGKRSQTQGTLNVLYNDLNAFANVFAFFIGVFSTVVNYIEGKVSWLFQALT